jgi:riboflavin synthase
MFTGIIQARGEIVSLNRGSSFVSIRIASSMELSDTFPGDSIAVDGACLTASLIDASKGEFSADVSPETLRVTTLGERNPGDMVNLEKAMRLDTRLGGHMVAGHVDCVGTLAGKRPMGPGQMLEFRVPSTRYLIEKGSVAVDGVSLTVNKVGRGDFQVMIIPHTSGLTGLTGKSIGAIVNIEFDMIGKYVEKFLMWDKTGPENKDRGITETKLKEHGFV